MGRLLHRWNYNAGQISATWWVMHCFEQQSCQMDDCVTCYGCCGSALRVTKSPLCSFPTDLAIEVPYAKVWVCELRYIVKLQEQIATRSPENSFEIYTIMKPWVNISKSHRNFYNFMCMTYLCACLAFSKASKTAKTLLIEPTWSGFSSKAKSKSVKRNMFYNFQRQMFLANHFIEFLFDQGEKRLPYQNAPNSKKILSSVAGSSWYFRSIP